MKKICFIIPGLNAGGMENYLLRFLNFLPEKSGVTVMVRNGEKGDLWNEYEKTGVNIRFQGIGYLDLLKWIKLFRYFNKEKFLTVCDFNGNFAGITMLISRHAGVCNRISFYRRSSDAFKQQWFRQTYNKMANSLVYYNSTKIFSNSQHAIDCFFPYRDPGDNRFKVIPNGIDPTTFNLRANVSEARRYFNLPQDKFIIGHVGRYDPAKNHETIFKVAQRLKPEEPNIIFLFAGRATDSHAFHERVHFYGIEDICFCLGLQTKIPFLYKTLDLFYFPSITEGQPNALIEAIMSGLPVIASDIPAIKEIFDKIDTDFLITPLDVDLACQTIKQACSDLTKLKACILKEKVTEKFHMDKNFNLFLKELINE